MCGIFGHLNPDGADPLLVERMAQRLAHRGPDGYGTHHSGSLAFGAGRLAIIDLSAPAGPIFNETRKISVVYNGEIYNHVSLRVELEALGHHFSTQTDTEVIVHGYESWGLAVVERLRGMFAFAIWDEPNARLLLARDRLGEKPLYYTWQGREFLFASEIKALFEWPGMPREVDEDSLLVYLLLGYTPAPGTMFGGIEKLAPGEMLVIDREGQQKRRYWQPVMEPVGSMDYREAVHRVRESLASAVQMRLMSDVPVGAFLSGGVDSTAVVALMGQALDRPVQTFTVGFDMERGGKSDEKFNVDMRYARLAADYLKTDHHDIVVKQDGFLSILLQQLVYAMDEPIAEQAMFQTAYVTAMARVAGVPVLLTGDCGDELFMGYDHFRMDRILARYLSIPGLLRNSVLTPLLEHAPARFSGLRKLARKSRHTDYTSRYLTWKGMVDRGSLPSLMADAGLAARAADVARQALLPMLDAPHTSHFVDRLAYAGLNSWIPENSNMRVDKMSMLMSVEARAPMEDHHFVELALQVPMQHKLRNGDFKTVLKEAVDDLVPEAIRKRSKWGFQPPISEWLRTTLRPAVETFLSADHVAKVGYFRPDAVRQLVDSHLSRRSYEVWTLFPLLIFHMWYALYVNESLHIDHIIRPQELLAEVQGRKFKLADS